MELLLRARRRIARRDVETAGQVVSSPASPDDADANDTDFGDFILRHG